MRNHSFEVSEIFKSVFYQSILRTVQLIKCYLESSISKLNNSQVVVERKQSPRVFCKKGVLGNFAKFTGKHQTPVSESLF